MFAIKCPYPYCQHENKPGARFCADCGAPLHLKPCPECGKVDDVAAKVCSSCNAVFPAIELAEYGASDNTESVQGTPEQPLSTSLESQPRRREKDQVHANRAWPMIVVALAAGGIPLLWMNRAYLPMPSAWQTSGPNAAGSAISPNTASPGPSPLPSTVTPSINQPPPIPAATLPSTIQTATGPAPEQKAMPADRVEESVEHSKKRHKDTFAKAHKPRSAVPSEEQPRPCTEAVAALGLCTPKQEAK